MIVVKFGGTSVGDAESIERTAEIVKGRLARQPAVVVSALGGATNSLLAIGEQSAKGHLIGALRGVETLRDRHFQQCEKLLGTSAGRLRRQSASKSPRTTASNSSTINPKPKATICTTLPPPRRATLASP